MYENSRTGVRIRPERVYENLQNQHVIWGPGAPNIPEGFVDIDGVTVVEGRQLRSWAFGLGDQVLSSQEADDIYRALLAELSGREPANDRPGVAART